MNKHPPHHHCHPGVESDEPDNCPHCGMALDGKDAGLLGVADPIKESTRDVETTARAVARSARHRLVVRHQQRPPAAVAGLVAGTGGRQPMRIRATPAREYPGRLRPCNRFPRRPAVAEFSGRGRFRAALRARLRRLQSCRSVPGRQSVRGEG